MEPDSVQDIKGMLAFVWTRDYLVMQDTRIHNTKPSSHKHGPKTQYGVVHIDVSKERNTTEKQDEDLVDWWQ